MPDNEPVPATFIVDALPFNTAYIGVGESVAGLGVMVEVGRPLAGSTAIASLLCTSLPLLPSIIA
jgi:hypothetical protein